MKNYNNSIKFIPVALVIVLVVAGIQQCNETAKNKQHEKVITNRADTIGLWND
jgi:large-conductance mechanosensitive channel